VRVVLLLAVLLGVGALAWLLFGSGNGTETGADGEDVVRETPEGTGGAPLREEAPLDRVAVTDPNELLPFPEEPLDPSSIVIRPEPGETTLTGASLLEQISRVCYVRAGSEETLAAVQSLELTGVPPDGVPLITLFGELGGHGFDAGIEGGVFLIARRGP
jgi:hypothetical protein